MLKVLLPLLTPMLGDIIKKIVPDSGKNSEIEREIKLALLESADGIEELRGKIVLAEASSSNWLTASWRPLLMMVIITIVALNYLMFPVINMFLGSTYAIDLPDQLWSLLQIGVGGYIVGRSGEKMITTWTNK